ncbi:MAG: DNA polymerase beta superfamily protein [Actinomycetota bacterium]
MAENRHHNILKVTVGSYAHGLARSGSDRDLRGVFITRTRHLLELKPDKKDTKRFEGDTDITWYEVWKFLLLATRCVPTILEVFLAPVVFEDDYGSRLKAMFSHVWSSKAVRDSFIGYGRNQQKKFLENKDGRANKYAAAHLRVLYNGYQLLSTGKKFDVNLAGSPVYDKVKKFKQGDYTPGEVVQECWEWEQRLVQAYRNFPDKETNFKLVDRYLLKVRKDFW